MTTRARIDLARDRCELALGNVRQGVVIDRRFPRNIFVAGWSEFFFFDSDWMTEVEFVNHVKVFLNIEGSLCACLWRLDTDGTDEPSVLFVREQTSVAEYGGRLAGNSPGHGWLDAMPRLACASDVGEWCMYCEPNNEIAVIGFRQRAASARYAAAMAQFRAEPLDVAIKEPLSYGFSQVVLSPEWRDQFVREYAPSAR
jgi:hypothetical protein